MKLFQRIFFAALLAGLLAGAAMSALQQWKVAPIILAAEVYEGQPVHDHDHAAATSEAVASAAEEPADWAPQDGAERIFYTVLADLLASVGFALVLAAVSTLSGIPITAANGLLWGLAGFAVFQFWPALGLAPELPGMPAADLVAREIWWWATALCAAAGFLGIAKFRNWTAIGVCIVLLLVPQIIGAPHAPDEPSAVPAELAAEFAAHALIVGAVFWLSVGPLLGWLSERFARTVPFARRVTA